MSLPPGFIHDLPKCELHVHIEGTLEPDMKSALARRNAIALPENEPVSGGFSDLSSFLAMYYGGMRVLRKEQDFYDLTFAYLKKARSQNIVYAEMFFDPQSHTGRGVAFDTVMGGIRRAQLDGDRLLGIRSQLILCILRDQGAEYGMATLLESLPYKDWIIGIGLDSDEKDNPPAKFQEVFDRARAEGYLLTMHCDVNQENSLAHIRQCVQLIGVSRIDHGVNALEDPELCDELRAKGIALTVCPLSNALIAGGSYAGAVKRMLDEGIRVTVNSDDPAYFGGYLEENLIRVEEEAALGSAGLAQLSRNAFEAAWLPRRVKDQYLALVDDFESRFRQPA
jgi:adenosine deaminase